MDNRIMTNIHQCHILLGEVRHNNEPPDTSSRHVTAPCSMPPSSSSPLPHSPLPPLAHAARHGTPPWTAPKWQPAEPPHLPQQPGSPAGQAGQAAVSKVCVHCQPECDCSDWIVGSCTNRPWVSSSADLPCSLLSFYNSSFLRCCDYKLMY